MTEFKLVPMEPTLDMLCEGTDVYGSEDCAETDVLGIYKAMLAASPAVQGEPVAYAVFAENGNIRIWCADPIQVETLRQQYGDQLKPLYSVPAPAIPEETLSPYEILGWCHAYFCCSLDAGEDPRTTEVGDIIEKMNRQLLAQPSPPTAKGVSDVE